MSLVLSKAWWSAVVAGGAVGALLLAHFTVTSGPGCVVVAGSRTACVEGNLAVAGIGVAITLIAITWGFRQLEIHAALLGTILVAGSLWALMRFGFEPGWGASDPLVPLLPLLAAVLAFGYARVATRHRFA